MKWQATKTVPAMFLATSPIELQSELHLPRILSRAADSESASVEIAAISLDCDRVISIVRHREVRVVKRVQEISPELDSHSFCDRKILLQADISVSSNRAQWPDPGPDNFQCARSGGANGRGLNH